MSGKKLKKKSKSKSAKKAQKRANGTGQRGVASGIHNAVLQRFQQNQAQLMNLQQILGCLVKTKGAQIVELVDVEGDWVLTLDEAPSAHEDGRAIKIDLTTREELEREERERIAAEAAEAEKSAPDAVENEQKVD